jgi:predicted ATPase
MYDRQKHGALGTVYGQDPGVSCLLYPSRTLRYLGYPDQALQQSQEALILARELSHPPTLAWALCAASWSRCYRREGKAGYELAEEAITFATKQELPHWIAMGKNMRGKALVELGRWEAAVAQIKEGSEAYRATGAQSLAVLSQAAQAYGQGGQPEEGLRVLDAVFANVDRPTIQQQGAEIYRIKGVLLLEKADPDTPQAEACFHKALSVARNQQAKSWELRAATRLALLWQSQDKRHDAYDLLAPVYERFTEGFDTADLQEAKALLETLAN